MNTNNVARVLGWTVQSIDENDGNPRLLASDIHFGGEAKWHPLDAEALASFTQRERPPFGHIWHSSRDLAADAARATRGALCVIEQDAEGMVTIRSVDLAAGARAEAFLEAAKMVLDARPFGTRDAKLEALAESIFKRGEAEYWSARGTERNEVIKP